MAWYEVEIPTTHSNGARGVQMFMYDAEYSAAERQALIDVHTEDAIRHSPGAEIDVKRIKVRPWSSGSL
jgi:hypothetical protein